MSASSGEVYLVVEDSPVFAALFASTVRDVVGAGGDVVRCGSFEEAEAHMTQGAVKLVVCGYGVGGGKTAHDLRAICRAPMVVMTGRPGSLDAPSSSTVLHKSAGPEKLRAAVAQVLREARVAL